MAKKSVLLEYVIRSILKMDGVIKPTSNYFVIATLQLLEKKGEWKYSRRNQGRYSCTKRA